MAAPKTSFYLSNGTKLVDIHPLESNGPASSGAPNQSIPNEIIDIDYASNTVVVSGDLSERLGSITGTMFGGAANSNTIVCATGAVFDSLMAAGLEVGMFVDIPLVAPETTQIVENRTRIIAIDQPTRSLTLSSDLSTAITDRTVKFCYPFNIIDLDPLTPSPYIGEYGAAQCVYNNGMSSITLSHCTPLRAASFDIVGAFAGTNGTWIIQGITNAIEVFYPNSTFTVTGNSYAPANTSYIVGSTVQSQAYNITDVVVTASNTVVTVSGNVGQFFIVTSPSPQQLIISNNTTHAVGTHPLNGAHDIIGVGAYNSGNDTTTITIGTVISGVDGPANGLIKPAIATTAITVNGLIVNGTQPEGILTAGSPIQLPFAAPPAITPTQPHSYIVSWRVAGDKTAIYHPGHSVTIKNNNYYKYKRLIIDSVDFDGTITEIRTVISDASLVTPAIGQTGSIVHPAMAVPYGHIQYTVLTPATPLQLVGRGVTHYNVGTTWGAALQNNAIHQLENFASDNAPVAPLEGQFWFDTSVPTMRIRHNGQWEGVMSTGMPAQGDLDMSGNGITNLADAINPLDAVNLQTGDARYVNVAGDSMTGALNMSGNVIDGIADIDQITPNLTQVLNVNSGDLRYVNVTGDIMTGELSMSNNRITHVMDPAESQDVATKAYVDSLSSGIVWLQSVLDPNLFDDSLGAPPTLTDGAMLYYRSYIVRPTKYTVSGVNEGTKTWYIQGTAAATTIIPGHKINVRGNTDTASNMQYTVQSVTTAGTETLVVTVEPIPTTVTISGYVYHAAGLWNGLDGHAVGWSGTQWVDILGRQVQPGDRFGVYFEVDNDEPTTPTPGGSFGVGSALGTASRPASGKIVTVNAVGEDYIIDWGTSTSSTYPPQTPVEPDAVSVLGANSAHYGHSYTFRGMWGTGAYNNDYKWIEFAGPSMLVDGAGLKYTGNILNVGQGTGITVSANAVGVNPVYFNTNYMRRDGTTAFTNNISMGGFKLEGVATPVAGTDAVNKAYADANFVSSSGASAMQGQLDMGGFNIVNVAQPLVPTDAANMAYVDTKVAKAGDTMTGPLVMSSATGLAYIDMGNTNKIVNLADPVNSRDAVNLQTADGRYVNVTGDTMTGPLSLHADPTQVMHAATKQYVDNTVADAVTSVQSATLDGGSF